jgi:prepilin-type N-terminal cleavage/methylation domain-containing protein
MLARIRKSMKDKDQGFTLIELLVVMIIIGILAAIAVPVFLNQRAKARDTAVKADVSTVGKEIATYFVDNTAVPVLAQAGGRYTLAATDIGAVSSGVTIATQNIVDASHWCVSLTNAEGSTDTFKYSARGGLASGDCAAADVA